MVIVAALVLSAGGTQPSAALPIAPAEGLAQEPPGRKSFHADRAMRHVRRLAGRIGVRLRATRGERRGASYLAKKLRAYGYRVRVPTFSVDGRTSRNVVARWPGSRRRAIVIGAHIDSVRGSPGANDNASGVAVMLELARVFAGRRASRYVRFIGFGSEEYGVDGRHHVGSHVYVRRIGRDGRRRVAGMVSVDMVADGRPLIAGTAGMASSVVARTLVRKFRRTGVRVVFRVTCDCSDNGPFERSGIPAAFVWSGTEPDYHSPSDTPRNLSPRDLRRTGRAMQAFVGAIDRGMIRRFLARR